MLNTPPPVLGMVLKGYPRISETFISNEILLLEQSGRRVHIFSMRQPREDFSHDSIQNIKAPVDYLPETISGNLYLFIKHNLKFALRHPVNYLKAAGLAWRRFRRTRKSATLKHLLQAGYLADRFLPGSGVTHFHAHFAHSPTSVAMFAAMLTGLKFSFTGHAKDIYTSNREQLIEKINKAEFVVTCTQYNADHLKDLASNGNVPIYRVYHGIDIRLFNSNEEIRHPASPYQILTVARLTGKKGLPTVYQALGILKDQGLEFEHTLIGEGDDRPEIEELIQSLELTENTRLLGAQPHGVVLEHYRRADVFVLGCRLMPNGDRDGIPNVLLESMAMGVPVVATRISGIPELVENEVSGLLAPPENPAELAAAIKRVLTDKDLRAAIIPRSRMKIRAEFDNTRLVTGLAELFRQAVGK